MLLITTPQQELDSRNEVACDEALGPPSELAQACDRSMDFLLGKEMSTGTLASIAKSVFGKKYIANNTTILSSASHSLYHGILLSFQSLQKYQIKNLYQNGFHGTKVSSTPQ